MLKTRLTLGSRNALAGRHMKDEGIHKSNSNRKKKYITKVSSYEKNNCLQGKCKKNIYLLPPNCVFCVNLYTELLEHKRKSQSAFPSKSYKYKQHNYLYNSLVCIAKDDQIPRVKRKRPWALILNILPNEVGWSCDPMWQVRNIFP